jgi:ATP-binding cassette subfamily C protein CydCD
VKVIDPRLFRYSRNSRGMLFFSVFLAALIAISTILQAFVLARIIVTLFQEHLAPGQLIEWTIFLSIIIGTRSALLFLTEIISARMSSRIISELRENIFRALFKEDSRIALASRTGSTSNLLTNGLFALQPYFAKFVPQLFIASVVPLLVGVVIAVTDLVSGLIILFTVPLIPLFGILIGRYTDVAVRRKWETLQTLSNHLFDLLSGITSLRVFGRANAQRKKLEESGESYRKETLSVLRITFLSSLALELIATLSVAVIAVTIGIRLIDGKIALFQGMAILILAPEVYWPIRNVAAYFHSASDGAAAAEETFNLLHTHYASEIVQRESLPPSWKIENISWNELEIHFQDRNPIIIPPGIAKKGQVLAITGSSGTGKSSFFSNLLGFNSLAKGKISISDLDNRILDISSLKSEEWRSLCSWVPQNPGFPPGTIETMFRSIRPHLSEADAWRTLRDCGIKRSELPKGLNSEIGDFTSGLSVGQIRRLAVARALLKNGDVFLLDEPTASVDDLSERELISLINSLKLLGKIVVVISHRTEVVHAADQVLDFTPIRQLQ